ncbi:alpha/beta hydrolase [Duganella sp. HSC-15S17]|uniref:Alpha/beta hydrolase n=1 Tax=Duganella violaceipulchra TaxID=2849652 RepID=A0AA41H5B7_9BURK|nr:alpha/beta hydrolase [Duganella violaceicalia]
MALLLLCAQAGAQQTVQLWPNGAPGSEQRHNEAETVQNTYISNIHDPSLTVVEADSRHANGAAVIVVPGGGHRMLVWNNEGLVAAKSLNRSGVTAFVLKYRLARDQGSTYSIENDAAADLRRAVRWVRAHAAQYKIDPNRLGIMGFSAELHMYAETDHAFNMGQRSERLSDVHWPDRLADWLADGGWLIPHAGQAPQGVPSPAR